MKRRLLTLAAVVALAGTGMAFFLAAVLTWSSPAPTFLRMNLRTEWRIAAGRIYYSTGKDLRGDTGLQPARISHQRLGLGFERHVARYYFNPDKHGAMVMTVWSVPCAYPGMIAASGALLVWLLGPRPIKPVACATCGYDLRATPDRCPECGAVPAEAAAR